MSTTQLIPDAQIIQLMPDPDHPVTHAELLEFARGVEQAVLASHLEDTRRLDAMESKRIALVPEYEGPWDAEVYGEDESPAVVGTGKTPREALDAALLEIKNRS